MSSGQTRVQHVVMLQRPTPWSSLRSCKRFSVSSGCISSAAVLNEEARTDEASMHLVVAEDVANVLAEEALDALAKLLHPFDVLLRHSPGTVRRIRRTRLEFPDLLLHLEVPGNVGHQIPNSRERLHRLNRHRLGEIQIPHPRHAHQLRDPVDLRRARAALARLAVPPRGKIVRLLRLDLKDGVEDHHPFSDLGGVVFESASLRIATEDSESNGAHHFISAMICFSSGGITGSGSRRTSIRPSAPLRTTMFTLPSASSLSG